jgi:hypothetical protein
MRFLDEVREHPFRQPEIRDDAVLQWLYDADLGRCPHNSNYPRKSLQPCEFKEVHRAGNCEETINEEENRSAYSSSQKQSPSNSGNSQH